MELKNTCCYEQRNSVRKEQDEPKYFMYNANKKYSNWWLDENVRENKNRELLPNSVLYKNDDKIIENENLLTYRCKSKQCKMNPTVATPPGIMNIKK